MSEPIESESLKLPSIAQGSAEKREKVGGKKLTSGELSRERIDGYIKKIYEATSALRSEAFAEVVSALIADKASLADRSEIALAGLRTAEEGSSGRPFIGCLRSGKMWPADAVRAGFELLMKLVSDETVDSKTLGPLIHGALVPLVWSFDEIAEPCWSAKARCDAVEKLLQLDTKLNENRIEPLLGLPDPVVRLMLKRAEKLLSSSGIAAPSVSLNTNRLLGFEWSRALVDPLVSDPPPSDCIEPVASIETASTTTSPTQIEPSDSRRVDRNAPRGEATAAAKSSDQTEGRSAKDRGLISAAQRAAQVQKQIELEALHAEVRELKEQLNASQMDRDGLASTIGKMQEQEDQHRLDKAQILRLEQFAEEQRVTILALEQRLAAVNAQLSQAKVSEFNRGVTVQRIRARKFCESKLTDIQSEAATLRGDAPEFIARAAKSMLEYLST